MSTESAFRNWTPVDTGGMEGVHVEYVGGERLGAAREVAEPGRVAPRHRHDKTEEIVMVTEGELDWTVGDETRTLGPGGVAVVAPGIEHELYTENGATYYLMFSPGLPTDDFILCPR